MPHTIELPPSRQLEDAKCSPAWGAPRGPHTEQPNFRYADPTEPQVECPGPLFDEVTLSLHRGGAAWNEGQLPGYEQTPLLCVSLADGEDWADGSHQFRQLYIYFDDRDSWRAAHRLGRLLVRPRPGCYHTELCERVAGWTNLGCNYVLTLRGGRR